MTEAQREALSWLRRHNSDGLFARDGVLMAGGERAPFMRGTWNALARAGYVEFYGTGRGRCRLTAAADRIASTSPERLDMRQAAMAPHPTDDDWPENSNHDDE